jgi:hypothetical protein
MWASIEASSSDQRAVIVPSNLKSSASSGKKNESVSSNRSGIEQSRAALDLDPGAWPKFEKLIKSAAKMGHKPHQSPKKKVRK